jgi:hypothetical protein
MWVTAQYQATALFTLKPATATSSGGKTLLVPTPYSIKMALLDAAFRVDGQVVATRAWDWLRAVGVAIEPAEQIVVNNTFAKVLRKRRNDAEPGSADEGFFGRTIAYREYAYLHDPFTLAVEVEADEHAHRVQRWLVSVNYLGRRGCFVQLQRPPEVLAEKPPACVRLDTTAEMFNLNGSLMTQLDDVGEDVSFARANIYSDEKITLGKHRVLRHIALPYRKVASSRSYTHYRRNQPDQPT